MTSGIEARVSKVLAPCSGAYSNALTTPNGGIAIFIPTRPMSKRASKPSDGAGRGLDVPYIFRGAGEVKVGAADFGQRPLSSTRDAQPMNSQPGKLSVFAGPRGKPAESPRLSMPSCFCCGYIHPTAARHLLFPDAVAPTFGAHAASGFDRRNSFTPFCRTACLSEWAAARPG